MSDSLQQFIDSVPNSKEPLTVIFQKDAIQDSLLNAMNVRESSPLN